MSHACGNFIVWILVGPRLNLEHLLCCLPPTWCSITASSPATQPSQQGEEACMHQPASFFCSWVVGVSLGLNFECALFFTDSICVLMLIHTTAQPISLAWMRLLFLFLFLGFGALLDWVLSVLCGLPPECLYQMVLVACFGNLFTFGCSSFELWLSCMCDSVAIRMLFWCPAMCWGKQGMCHICWKSIRTAGLVQLLETAMVKIFSQFSIWKSF